MKPPSYPARPVNGGPLDKSPPKLGEWCFEPKYNGWRALVHVPTGKMFNRRSQPLSIQAEFAQAIHALQAVNKVHHIEWLDCEALERRHGIGRGCLIVLDYIDQAARPHCIRRDKLVNLLDELEWLRPPRHGFPPVSVSPRLSDPPAAWFDLQAINRELGCDFYEGVVAKRVDSPYPIQLRSPELEFPFWVKHRWRF